MATLNEDLTYRDLYLNIKERIPFDFIAKREDIKFNNIEQKFPLINFGIPFRLQEFQHLQTIINMLLQESIGKITIDPFDKLRLLVKVYDGEIFYHKIGNGEEWRVMLYF